MKIRAAAFERELENGLGSHGGRGLGNRVGFRIVRIAGEGSDRSVELDFRMNAARPLFGMVQRDIEDDLRADELDGLVARTRRRKSDGDR